MADGATKFDSSSDYLTVTSANMDFTNVVGYTVEFFYSVSNLPTADVVLFGNYSTVGTYAIRIAINSSGHLQIDLTDSGGSSMGSALVTSFQGFNTWRHVAVSGTGSSGSIYANGTRLTTYSSALQMRTSTAARIAYQASGRWAGAISNLRVVKGTDLYGLSTLTVPTARLTAVTNTKLLTCVEHNSLTDQSGLAQTITQTGSPTPILSSPFTNYFGVISREDFNPYSNIPEQNQRWQTFDNRVRYS